MRHYAKQSELPVSAQEAFAWHMRQGAFERLTPAWSDTELAEFPKPLTEGSIAVIKIGLPVIKLRWVARHTEVVAPDYFEDVQESGPFAFWKHRHMFTEKSDSRCYLIDEIDFALPFGVERIRFFERLVTMKLEKMFEHRHEVTQRDLELRKKNMDKKTLEIRLTGSSGLVGSALKPLLTTQGHSVKSLVRDQSAVDEESLFWNPSSDVLAPEVLQGADAVIHLAGENIADGRWTASKKQRIKDSRIRSTKLLSDAIAAMDNPPSTLIVASAIGYYGDRGDEVLSEDSRSGSDFLASVCKEWEEATQSAKNAGVRVVHMRLGVVLSPAGGALQKMLTPFKLGAGGPLGSGKQYMSWVSLEDVIGAIYHVLMNDSVHGAVNTTAPNPVTNQRFTQALGRVLSRPAFMPAPAFALKLLLGEMAEALLLSSTRVVPEKLKSSGYEFRHPEIDGALKSLLGK